MIWKVPFNANCLVPLGCSIAERSPLLKHAAFSSTNFENIFKWESEEETPPGTVYEVQYKRYVGFAFPLGPCLNGC